MLGCSRKRRAVNQVDDWANLEADSIEAGSLEQLTWAVLIVHEEEVGAGRQAHQVGRADGVKGLDSDAVAHPVQSRQARQLHFQGAASPIEAATLSGYRY